jgi:hypothetical protein
MTVRTDVLIAIVKWEILIEKSFRVTFFHFSPTGFNVNVFSSGTHFCITGSTCNCLLEVKQLTSIQLMKWPGVISYRVLIPPTDSQQKHQASRCC